MALVSWTDAATPGDGRRHLEALAERLRRDGWYARIVTPTARGAVRVVNPAAPPLNDEITVEPDEAGLWWFHWSFGTRIAHAENLDITAARITHALSCSGR